MKLHRHNCADPGGAAGRPGLCIHRSSFGREHGAEQTECGASVGVRPHTTHGWVVTNLQCSLSRRRMVFAAMRRRRAAGLSDMIVGPPAGSSDDAANGSPSEPGGRSIGAVPQFAVVTCDQLSLLGAAASIAASRSRKLASTDSASTEDNIFLTGRFL